MGFLPEVGVNIKSIIPPLIFGQEKINDENWDIKISVLAGFYRGNMRIACKNTFELTTRAGLKREVDFTVVLLINGDGDLSFYKITLGQFGNIKVRAATKDLLYKLFRESIENKLNES